MANDKTFGVRITDEMEKRIELLSGGNKREWFEKLVAMAEIQDLKEGAVDYKQDLSELEIHTTRIYELVANMIQRANYLKDDAVRGLAEKLDSRELTISGLQSNVKDLQEQLSQLQQQSSEHATEKEELTEQLEGLRAMNANNQDLIQEYKEKIDTLSSLVNQYKGYADENVELKEAFAAEKERVTAEFQQKESRLVSSIEELKLTANDQQTQLEQLTEKLNNTISAHENELKSIDVNHVNELTQLTNEKNLERERAVLEVERQYQEKLQAIHDQYNDKLANLYSKFESGNEKGQAPGKPGNKK